MLAGGSSFYAHGPGAISFCVYQQSEDREQWNEVNYLRITLTSNTPCFETRSKHVIEVALDKLRLPS